MKNIKTLIERGILQFAKEPQNNPDRLVFPSYTVPLIEHDYPAKTPIMWNAVYETFNMPTRNVMLVGNSGYGREIFETLRNDRGYLGGGAGVGFKDESPQYLDELDSLAKEIGSVNFILKTRENKLRGFNTDGVGYAQSLEDIFRAKEGTLEGKKAVILGAGGTGNAVAFALAQKGMRIVILNRTVKKAEVLAEKINEFFKLEGESKVRFGGEDLITAEVSDADAVINVSTKGAAGDFEKYSALAPAKLPASEENIRQNLVLSTQALAEVPKTAVISDIILRNDPTPFLKTAAENGFKTLDGVPMVINQGVEAFWLLHGDELSGKNITKQDVLKIMQKAALT